MKGSMYSTIKNATEECKTETALVTMGNAISFEKLFADIDYLAIGLIAIGVKKGDSVAINLPNFAEAIVAFYAINKCGAVANIIHPLTPAKDLVDKTLVTGAKFLFTQDIFLADKIAALRNANITPIVCRIGYYAKNIKGGVMRLAMSGKTKFLKTSEGFITYGALMKKGRAKKSTIDENTKAVKNITQKEIERKNVAVTKGAEINIQGVNTTIKGICFPKVEEKDVAIVLHSGGTTGIPKSIELSNFALNSLAVSLEKIVKKENVDDSLLMVLPLFHGFGLGVCMHTGLFLGFRLIMMESFNAKKAVKLMKKYKVAVVAGVPTMYSKILREENFNRESIENLRAVFCGGDKLPTKLKKEFDKKLKECGSITELSEGYGLTEVVTVCTVNRQGESEENSVGSPLENIRLSIKNLETDDNLPPLAIGEICVTGDTLMTGYYHDDDATSATMRRDKDGVVWVHSGDLGYMNEHGKLFFLERAKRLIKISGINVFPAQIESIAYEHDSVKHCAIKEYTEGDKNYLELFVVVKDGIVADEKLKEKILAMCAEKLMKYSIPKKITYRDSLPLTTVGKVDYKKL